MIANPHRLQESVPIETQMRHLGQKYMGIRPQQSHADAVFAGALTDVNAKHPVPISNFMNAQCMLKPRLIEMQTRSVADTELYYRLLRDYHRNSSPDLQGGLGHGQLQPLGPLERVWLHSMLPALQV